MIINADDLGLTRSINYAIIDSFKNKAISSASLMVNTMATNHAVELMHLYSVTDIGVHINVTFGKPLSNLEDIPSLVDQSGYFHGNKWWEKNSANEAELILEFETQITRFKELTGFFPKHINHHHIIDFYTSYPKLAKKMFDYDVPMRLEENYDLYSFEYIKSLKIVLKENQYEFLNEIHSEIVELPCHVGYIDLDLLKSSSLTDQRMKDYAILNDPIFIKRYKELGFRLVSWSSVKNDQPK